MTSLPPTPGKEQPPPEVNGERYVAALAIGWDPKAGIRLTTTGPVPESGDVNIVAVGHLNGQPVPIPTEPFPAEHLARWRGYSLDMHGGFALDPTHPQEPMWRFFKDDGTPLYTLELDRIRVQAAGSDLFAELLVLPIPERPIRVALFGWDHHMPPRIPPADEIEKAVHGLELLGLVRELEAARRGGRPAMSEQEALNEAITHAREWLADHPRKILDDLKRQDLADRRGVGLKSQGEWMRTKHFTLKTVRDQLRRELEGV